MLKAIEKETGEYKIAWLDCIAREWEFICPECKEKVVFVNATHKIKHFRHLIKSNCDPEPETQKHIEMKKFIIEKMNLDPRKNLEVGLGFARPDIYCEKSSTFKVAIEVQHSPISYEKFLERTVNYRKNNIHVLWIFDDCLLKELKEKNRAAFPRWGKISNILKKAHELYYGKVYIYKFGGIFPVHFSEEGRWIDDYKEYSGYYKIYKKIKKLSFGNKIDNFLPKPTYNQWNDCFIATFHDEVFWK